MATNILDSLKSELEGENSLSQISQAIGEDGAKTQAALEGAIPALVGGLANKASTTQGADDLLNLLKQNHFDESDRLSSLASEVTKPNGITKLAEMGRPLLGNILGPRTKSITDWVASSGGIKGSSAASLLGLALPFVLGKIGSLVRSSGWNATSLMNVLAGQKNFLQAAPAGLASVLGPSFGGDFKSEPLRTSPTYVHTATTNPTYAKEPIHHGSSWWKWVLPLLALLGLLGYLFSRREMPAQRTVIETESVRVAAPQTAPVRTDLGNFMSRTLPNGTTLSVPANGLESKLIAFIENPSMPVSPTNWFNFDRLEFETNSAVLKASSAEQVKNIADILKAYPQVNVKFGGYTDNIGNAAANLKLSQERANYMMQQVAAAGIAPSRLAAEGYGDKFPVASNATEEGRQRNRRIDILVTKK